VIGRKDGSRWLVPLEDHAPITQDVVLLNPGKHSQAAKDFLAFLKGEEAVRIIRGFGYGVGTD
jgi:molybdate transport system substrate-binding protein